MIVHSYKLFFRGLMKNTLTKGFFVRSGIDQGTRNQSFVKFCSLKKLGVYINSIYLYTNTEPMKNLSLKLEDDIFQETEHIISKVKKNRNRYINEAVEFYNRLYKRKLLSEQLGKESKIVAQDSMEVLAEFEKLFDEDQAI